MKTYYVLFKLYQAPGACCSKIVASNKAEARMKFKELNIKHDYIIRVLV